MLKTTVLYSVSRILRSLLLCLMLVSVLAGTRSTSLAQGGKPWAWGDNGYGQLGDGTTTNRNTLVPVSVLSGVAQLAGGRTYSLSLKLDGTVWAWGGNSYGQLGDGTTTDRYTPMQVPGLTGVVQVSSGYYHAVTLKSDGTVWTWGNNDYGQLGDGTTDYKSTPLQVQGLTEVVQVAGGSIHCLALKSDGTVWGWGENADGELGDGTTIDRGTPVKVSGLTGVAQIAVGNWHCFALKSDGSVWAWGWNGSGGVGDGTSGNIRIVPVQLTGLTGVVKIVGGGTHSLALKLDGTVWAWGNNNSGQLGDGTTLSKATPFQIPDLVGVVQLAGGGAQYGGHSLAVKSDGTVWAWGDNKDGQLGDGTTDNRTTPVQVTGLVGVAHIAAGWLHSLAIGNVKVQDTVSIASNITLLYGKITLVSTLKNKSSGKTIPNRPVAFTLNGTAVGTANTDAAGRAYLFVPNSTDYGVGAYPFTTSFAGDAFYNLSNASAILTVKKADVLTTIRAVGGSPGDTKYLTATLTRTSDNAPLVNQSVAFKLDGVPVGTATTDGTGTASTAYTFKEGAVGSHALKTRYAGDSNHSVSTGTGTVTVNPAATTLIASSASGRIGQTVSFVATLTRNTDQAGVVGRTVVFKLAGNQAGSAVTDSTGKATLAYKIDESIPVGRVVLSAVFTGDSDYLASANLKQRSLSIGKAKTKLIARSITGKPGVTVMLTATLIRTTDSVGLSGKAVRFQIEGVDAGTVKTDGNGVATLSYTIPTTLSVGKHGMTILFEEDAFYLGYTANGVSLIVK